MAAPVISGGGSREARQHEMNMDNAFATEPLDFIQVFGKFSEAELLNFSLEELASKFGCSRGQLNGLFQKHFGCSLTTLRLELRLLKAATLLQQPGATVITVAERCGFNHPGLFSICFERRFGLTPAAWSGDGPISKAARQRAINGLGKRMRAVCGRPRAAGEAINGEAKESVRQIPLLRENWKHAVPDTQDRA